LQRRWRNPRQVSAASARGRGSRTRARGMCARCAVRARAGACVRAHTGAGGGTTALRWAQRRHGAPGREGHGLHGRLALADVQQLRLRHRVIHAHAWRRASAEERAGAVSGRRCTRPEELAASCRRTHRPRATSPAAARPCCTARPRRALCARQRRGCQAHARAARRSANPATAAHALRDSLHSVTQRRRGAHCRSLEGAKDLGPSAPHTHTVAPSGPRAVLRGHAGGAIRVSGGVSRTTARCHTHTPEQGQRSAHQAASAAAPPPWLATRRARALLCGGKPASRPRGASRPEAR
jgi:hypothetical protein